MRPAFFASVPWAVLSWLAISVDAQETTGIVGRTYVNVDYDFRISLPEEMTDWDITDETGGMGLLVIVGPVRGSFRPNVNVVAERLTPSVTLDEYFEASVQALPSFVSNWKEESRARIAVDGRAGYELVYTGELLEMSLAWIQHIAIADDTAYIITGSGVEADFPLDAFRQIMSTFEFLHSPSLVNSATWGQVKGDFRR